MVENQRQQLDILPIPQPRKGVRRAVLPWKVTVLVEIILLVLAVIVLAVLVALNGLGPVYPVERSHYEMLKAEESDIMVTLPDAHKKRTALSSATKLIVVNVRGEDRNEGDALYVVSGSKVDLLQLRKMIADGVKANKNQKVLIRGDKLALHGNVANAVAACRDGGGVETNIGYDYVPTK